MAKLPLFNTVKIKVRDDRGDSSSEPIRVSLSGGAMHRVVSRGSGEVTFKGAPAGTSSVTIIRGKFARREEIVIPASGEVSATFDPPAFDPKKNGLSFCLKRIVLLKSVDKTLGLFKRKSAQIFYVPIFSAAGPIDSKIEIGNIDKTTIDVRVGEPYAYRKPIELFRVPPPIEFVNYRVLFFDSDASSRRFMTQVGKVLSGAGVTGVIDRQSDEWFKDGAKILSDIFSNFGVNEDDKIGDFQGGLGPTHDYNLGEDQPEADFEMGGSGNAPSGSNKAIKKGWLDQDPQGRIAVRFVVEPRA